MFYIEEEEEQKGPLQVWRIIWKVSFSKIVTGADVCDA
jgi:hypothetical protein